MEVAFAARPETRVGTSLAVCLLLAAILVGVVLSSLLRERSEASSKTFFTDWSGHLDRIMSWTDSLV